MLCYATIDQDADVVMASRVFAATTHDPGGVQRNTWATDLSSEIRTRNLLIPLDRL